MKTSNKLITLLFALIFVSIIGSSFSLKSEFEKIDKNDPYLGYSHETLQAFKYVKLTGNAFGTVQLQPGKTFEMRMIDVRNYNDHPKVSHRVSRDTLIVSFTRDGLQNKMWDGIFRMNPALYISAPEIVGLTSHHVPCIIKGWDNVDFSIDQTGQGILLRKNQFENLKISSSKEAYIGIEGDNTVGTANVTLLDSSIFVSKKDVYKSFSINMDDKAQVILPGSLIKKVSQNN